MPGIDKLPVFPVTSKVTAEGHLSIGDVDIVDLADQKGTPLYVFDKETLISTANDFRTAFENHYPEVQVVYACKAWTNISILQILNDEGLGFDVVSGGEIAILQAGGISLEKTYFHGNNKSKEELRAAVEGGIGRIVIDNPYEMDLLESILEDMDRTQKVLFRISPGVDPHTHSKTTTGILDSKFGIPIQTGQAEEVIAKAMGSKRIICSGLHFHLGSPITELDPYIDAINITLQFASEMRERYGFNLSEFSPGGGFASKYLLSDEVPKASVYADAICTAIKIKSSSLNMPLPKISIEPGRSIINTAGVAIYRTGVIKNIPGIRTYVSVDGGMGDNIRPAIYGSEYEAILPSRMREEEKVIVTIAGKYCESGDILVKDCNLPEPRPGDLVAIPASGAYGFSMSSNYNASPRPEAVLIEDGEVKTIRRRETYSDIFRHDLV